MIYEYIICNSKYSLNTALVGELFITSYCLSDVSFPFFITGLYINVRKNRNWNIFVFNSVLYFYDKIKKTSKIKQTNKNNKNKSKQHKTKTKARLTNKQKQMKTKQANKHKQEGKNRYNSTVFRPNS